ncbi:MAG: hypothetical protein ACREVE_13180 [Gammaproteobacteria bacterium]
MVTDALVGLAAVITATAALFGLIIGRRELQTRAEFDVARKLIRATYRLRDAVQTFRSPLIRQSEFPRGHEDGMASKTPEETAKAYAYMYENRWIPVWDAVQEFDTHTLEAEALWGKPMRTQTDELRQCVIELYTAVEAVIRDKAQQGDDFKADKKFAKEMRSTVSSVGGDEKNPLSIKIAAAIKGIEDQIRPHLRRS